MGEAGRNWEWEEVSAQSSCESAFDALRSELLETMDGNSSWARLRPTVRRLCMVARDEEMRAEELLVRFKDLWAHLPQLAGLPRGRQRNDLMARVATMCIEEFYGPATNGESPHES